MPATRLSHWLTTYSLKARLYFVVLFLSVLPVLGVVLALAAFDSARRDRAALEQATHGTIHLERINGLVYAVVMESRGIYMSRDWKAAEPFADRLLKGLVELKAAARAWRESAIVAQRSNVDELSRRLDQFIEFRTELARLARDDSTATARVFGDNDANRNVRTALNQSLQVLARAYEIEIAHTRAQIDDNDQGVLVTLASLALLALLAFFCSLTLIRAGLLKPLLTIRDSMQKLASGKVDVAVACGDRRDEIGEMARTVAIFQATSRDRVKLGREARLLSELNEWLQSCKSLDELYQMVGDFLEKLLPSCGGGLFIYSNSRDVLERARVWNGGEAAAAMHPDDCWGLRRGRTYIFGENEIDFCCAHVQSGKADRYCCIPILAHGETIGLLHLAFTDRDDHGQAIEACSITDQRRLGLMCAEQISLAIANVRLRDQLRDQSIRDPLTGMYNRRYMLETCRREFARAARASQAVSVLSMDVDHFKKFNDNHGHDAGDTVLRAVGECLKAQFRDDDVACRFGGEEFVVILPGATVDVAMRRAEDTRREIEGLVVRYLDAVLPRITLSIGVAAYPLAGRTPEVVLKSADDALYLAKDGGRNCVRLSPCSGTQTEAGQPCAHANGNMSPFIGIELNSAQSA